MEEIEFEEELAPTLIAINITKGDSILEEEDFPPDFPPKRNHGQQATNLVFTLRYSDEKYYSFRKSIPSIQKSNFRFNIYCHFLTLWG